MPPRSYTGDDRGRTGERVRDVEIVQAEAQQLSLDSTDSTWNSSDEDDDEEDGAIVHENDAIVHADESSTTRGGRNARESVGPQPLAKATPSRRAHDDRDDDVGESTGTSGGSTALADCTLAANLLGGDKCERDANHANTASGGNKWEELDSEGLELKNRVQESANDSSNNNNNNKRNKSHSAERVEIHHHHHDPADEMNIAEPQVQQRESESEPKAKSETYRISRARGENINSVDSRTNQLECFAGDSSYRRTEGTKREQQQVDLKPNSSDRIEQKNQVHIDSLTSFNFNANLPLPSQLVSETSTLRAKTKTNTTDEESNRWGERDDRWREEIELRKQQQQAESSRSTARRPREEVERGEKEESAKSPEVGGNLKSAASGHQVVDEDERRRRQQEPQGGGKLSRDLNDNIVGSMATEKLDATATGGRPTGALQVVGEVAAVETPVKPTRKVVARPAEKTDIGTATLREREQQREHDRRGDETGEAQHRLSTYENVEESDDNSRRKVPVKPPHLAKLMRNSSAFTTLDWSVADEDARATTTTTTGKAEHQVVAERPQPAAEEAPAKPVRSTARRQLVAMTSIVQEPNDALMVASSTGAREERRRVLSGSGRGHLEEQGEAEGEDDDKSETTTTTSSSFAIARESRRRILSGFEPPPPRVEKPSQVSTGAAGGRKVGALVAKQVAAAAAAAAPTTGTSTTTTASKSQGTDSLVKQMAKSFERAASSGNSSMDTTTVIHQPPAPPNRPQVPPKPSASLRSTASMDESESTWYDAKSAELLDEAEVSELLREFETSAERQVRRATGGEQLGGANVVGNLSAASEMFVTVASDRTIEGDSANTNLNSNGSNNNNNNNDDDDDDTLNDNQDIAELDDVDDDVDDASERVGGGSGNLLSASDSSTSDTGGLTGGDKNTARESQTSDIHEDNNNNNKQDNDTNVDIDSNKSDSILVNGPSAEAAAATTTAQVETVERNTEDLSLSPAGGRSEREATIFGEDAVLTTMTTTTTTTFPSQVDQEFKNSLSHMIAQRRSKSPTGAKFSSQPATGDIPTARDPESKQVGERESRRKKLKGLRRYCRAVMKTVGRQQPEEAARKKQQRQKPTGGREEVSAQQASSASSASSSRATSSCVSLNSSDVEDDEDEDDDEEPTERLDDKQLVRAAKQCSRLYEELEQILASRQRQQQSQSQVRTQPVGDLEEEDDDEDLESASIAAAAEERQQQQQQQQQQRRRMHQLLQPASSADDDSLGPPISGERDDQVSLSSSSVSSESLPELRLRRNLQKLYHVVTEIHASESKFVATLRLLNEHFRRHMLQQSQSQVSGDLVAGSATTTTIADLGDNDTRSTSSTSLVNQSSQQQQQQLSQQQADSSCVIAALKHLPPLQALNENLLAELQLARDQWPKTQKIAHVLVKMGPFLKHYSTYIREFEATQQLLLEGTKKSPQLAERLREFEALPICEKLSVFHHLLKPVQRIPQYRLLLQQYLHHLKPDDADYEDTVSALEVVSRVAEHANQSMSEGANFAKLLALQAKIVGKQSDIVQPGRVFVREGELMKVCRKQVQPRWFVLLSDVLLYLTQIQSSDILYLNNELPLDDCQVSTPGENDGLELIGQQFETELSVCSRTRSFTLVAKTRQERDDWVSALRRTIDEHQARRRSFLLRQTQQQHARSADLEGAETSTSTPTPTQTGGDRQVSMEPADGLLLGQKAPLWTPDSRVTMCQLCTSSFSALFRRHHCRACGRVVCSACSSSKAPLVYLKCRVARVCDHCFHLLRSDIARFYLPAAPLDGELRRLDEHFRALLRSQFVRNAGLSGLRGLTRKPSGASQASQSAGLLACPPAANDSGSTISGHLHRQHHNRWKRRWFVIRDRVLYAYRAIDDVAAVESLPLLGYTVDRPPTAVDGIEPASLVRLRHRSHHAGARDDRRRELVHLFKAESVGAAERWLEAFRRSAVLEADDSVER